MQFVPFALMELSLQMDVVDEVFRLAEHVPNFKRLSDWFECETARNRRIIGRTHDRETIGSPPRTKASHVLRMRIVLACCDPSS